VNNRLMKAQTILVYAVQVICIALFVVYLGFMTHYYILFYDGTFEMFEYYKQLQVFNKEAFSLAVQFVVFALLLFIFELQKVRPGLFGLIAVFTMTIYTTMNSFALINVLPKYKRGYVSLDFSSMEDYIPSTFAFDTAVVLHYLLIGLMVLFTLVATTTFIQRLRDGNPIIRNLT
jgi:hypothetical protein